MNIRSLRKLVFMGLILFFIGIMGQNLHPGSGKPTRVIKFNPNFEVIEKKNGEEVIAKEKIPPIAFGKPITLTGNLAPNIINLEVITIVNSVSKEIEITLGKDHWNAIVGPFPPGQDVVFTFKVTKKMSDEEKENFLKNLKAALMNIAKRSVKEIKVTDELKFWKLMKEMVMEELQSTTFDSYKAENYKTIPEVVAEELEKTGVITIINGVFKEISNIEQAKNNIKREKEKIEQAKKDNDTKKESKSNEELKKFNEDLKKAEDNLKTHLKDLVDTIVARAKEVKIISYADTFTTSAEISDLERYAGFDIAAIYIAGKDSVGTFFTINPYFKPVDLNREPNGFLEKISLSVGIALNASNIDKDGNMYYAGFGYRLNKLLRLNAGVTFFKEKDRENHEYRFGAGLSVNFRDFGDILKVFQGSSGYFEN